MAEGKLRRARDRLAREGLGPTVRKAIGDHLFRQSASVVLELRDHTSPLGQVRLEPGMRNVLLRKGDTVPPLCPFLAHRRADFEAMLAADKVGFLILRDGTTVGCAWVALSDHHDAKAREHYPVAPGEAYHYSWLLDPLERPRGTALPFVRWVLGTLRDMGIHRTFAVVDRDNRPSYRVLQRFGYRECGMMVRHIYVLHTRWTRLSRYDGTLGLRDPRFGRNAS